MEKRSIILRYINFLFYSILYIHNFIFGLGLGLEILASFNITGVDEPLQLWLTLNWLQVLLLAMFLSCILKKPDVDDDDLTEDDNNLKQDEEFLSRSERDIQGTEQPWNVKIEAQLSYCCDSRSYCVRRTA